MSDEKPPQPPAKTTVAFEKVPDWAIALTEKVTTGFNEQSTRADQQDERLDKIQRQVDVAVSDGKENNLRVTRLEVRFDEKDKRDETRSVRVRQESATNLKQDAAIANVITRLATVEENQEAAKLERAETAANVVAIKDAVVKSSGVVVGVLTNPKVVWFAKFVFAVAALYSAAHGLGVAP